MHTGQGPDRDAEKVNSAVQLDRPCLVGEILTSTISVNAEWQRVSSIIIVRSSAAVFFPFEATVLVSPALSEERRYARGWLPDRSPDQHRGVQIIYPDRCNRLDYEGEIAIVLGKRGVDLKPSQLRDYVWGVTMLADWSIRAPRELPGGPLNFNFPKNFDTSCSMGPCLVVGEIDLTNIDLETLVNGERRQRFSTRDMVFSFGEYLEYLSRDFTLYPGDIISGGTAAGTAADSSELLPDKTSAPERFLSRRSRNQKG